MVSSPGGGRTVGEGGGGGRGGPEEREDGAGRGFYTLVAGTLRRHPGMSLLVSLGGSIADRPYSDPYRCCVSLESSYVLIPLSRSPHVTDYSVPLPPDMQFLKLRPQTRRVKEESPWAQCAPTRPRLIDPPTVPPLFGLVTANAAR